LPVLFAIDRAGIVGPDGPTHAGSMDLSFLRCVPNMVIMAPSDEEECRAMLNTGYAHDGPAAVRYPRGTGPGVAVSRSLSPIAIGKGEQLRQGEGIALLAFGAMLPAALEVAERVNGSVANMRFVKPLDEALLCELAASHTLLVTLEDNAVMGGAGSAVNEALAAHGISTLVLNLGLPDRFVEQGSREELLALCGLDRDGILRSIETFAATNGCQTLASQLIS
ncbi:MAG: 1-deoxy-D-xylulose-5-phosphate synthase, partial [Gammaproteobacteria bacterium]|nr:1-deoxy-D-xylulose-5-phosphate synthase [Gammaproteobacteria bacterium]